MHDFYQYLNIPDTCLLGNTIFKKLFQERADLGKADRELFKTEVDKVVWAYCLKPETTNIQLYRDEEREYAEVEIIEARVLTDKKTRRLAEIIMRTIPYPMLLVFIREECIQLCVAHQRTNLADLSRNTIEEFIFTPWLDLERIGEKEQNFLTGLEFRSLSQQNYYRLYSDLVDRVVIYKALLLIDGYIEDKPAAEVKAIYERVGEVEEKIKGLMLKVKSETQLNRRIELNIEIKKLEIRKTEILKKMKAGE
jgi:hypothetical protein